MQKQGIKVSSAWQINIPTSPEELRTDPDLHLFHTRMSVALTPGSQAAIQAVFGKRSKRVRDAAFFLIIMLVTFAATL